MNNIKSATRLVLFILGASLLVLNIYGLSKEIRPTYIFEDELRFENDYSLSYQEAILTSRRIEYETEKEYSRRITFTISQSLAHIHWNKTNDQKFNQLIPAWENYILFLMGKFSNIPEYQKYHFANYKRSLERGIGICGDAAMVMSQLLDINNIKNKIVSFPGHVVIKATFKNGTQEIYDPDFGVTIPLTLRELRNNSSLAKQYYSDNGYTPNDLKTVERIYNNDFKQWNGVSHFITKKYYFEYLSYLLKWALPILFIFISLWRITLIRSNLSK